MKRTPASALLIAFALASASAPSWADELRERQLESDVRRLERELDAQSRRIEQLERAARNDTSARITPNVPQHTDESPLWLATDRWSKLRPGMQELDVIALLGRPTSVRMDAQAKTRALLYALELGPNAVLAGNVRLNDSGVIEINRPVLR